MSDRITDQENNDRKNIAEVLPDTKYTATILGCFFALALAGDIMYAANVQDDHLDGIWGGLIHAVVGVLGVAFIAGLLAWRGSCNETAVAARKVKIERELFEQMQKATDERVDEHYGRVLAMFEAIIAGNSAIREQLRALDASTISDGMVRQMLAHVDQVAAGAVAGMASRIDELATRVEALDRVIASVEANRADSQQALEDRLAQVETTGRETQQAVTGLTGKLSDIQTFAADMAEARFAAVEAKANGHGDGPAEVLPMHRLTRG